MRHACLPINDHDTEVNTVPFPISPLRTVAAISFLWMILLNGCGGDNPIAPPFEHLPPIDGTIYYLQEIEEKFVGADPDIDTTLYSIRAEVKATEEYGDAYNFAEMQAGGRDFVTLQYLESGDIRHIILDTNDADYILPYAGGAEPLYDTTDLGGFYATHTTQYIGEESVTYDGRTYMARVVTDRFVEKVGGQSAGFGIGGVRTSYYVPELGYPVTERVEIGPFDAFDAQGNLTEVYTVSTFTVTRIIR
jgi:hypothetical protein